MIRETEKDGTITERIYQSAAHGQNRVRKCMQENKEIVLCTMEGMWHLKPDDIVGSSAKAIQTISDNMTKKLDTYLNSLSSYIDAVGSLGQPINPDDIIGEAACKMSKYMKIQMDKVSEYVQKETNKSLNTVVSGMPSSARAAMGDIKEVTGELLLCQYNKITNDMCGMIEGVLKDMLNFDKMEEKARANADNPSDEIVTPKVPPCVAEDIIGQVLSANKDAIDTANNSLLDNINAFLQDIRDQMAGISGAMSNITNLIGKISGSMSSALSFENVKLNAFGCELSPTPAVSDYYTFCTGGSGVKDTAIPSVKSIEEAVNKPTTATATEPIPFVEPTRQGTQNLNAEEDWDSEFDRFPRLFKGHEEIPGLTWPTTTFDKKMSLFLGKRRVDLYFLGRAHTAGDIVIHVPDSNVLFTGDIVEYKSACYCGDAHLQEWPKTLGKIAKFQAVSLVPGRGDALTDPRQINDAIELTEDFVTSTFKSVSRIAYAGGDLKEAMSSCRDECDKKFSNYAIYEHCLPFNVSRAFDEAKGINHPRIWTAERDKEMWDLLQ